MRVHELAKDLDLSSKELLTQLADLGIEAKSHMSTLEDDTVEMLLDEHTKAGNTDEPVPVKDDEETQQEPDSSSVAPRQVQEEAPEQEEAPGDPVATEDDKILKVRGGLTVRELAEKMDVRPNKIITALMKANTFASINDKLDLPVIKELGETFGFQVEQEKRGAEHSPQTKPPDEDELVIEDSAEDLMTRPPVVAFLGHVDHGKTSLLDRIRDTSVAKGESGGITQHIGAYTIDVNGQRVTFLDTPGHAAFTAMRARGANLTDIAIIIIAADDGIMPQTKEAIAHAKAAGVSIMVAINKVDLPTANPDRVLQQLQSEDLAPEDWGGETICCNVS
ncbi:translation initiation factor IF-2 N-terminal domain-containing protein, partial [PVC group bacterium]|nr:translation initiation factor IF-2 N-terminal domain-containing protein [PVC group bacterium]